MTPPPGRPGTVVALEGPSASGKSVVGRELSRILGGGLVLEAYERIRPALPLTVDDRAGLLDLELRLLREEGERWREADARRRSDRFVVLDTATFGPLTYSWGLKEDVDPALDVVPDLVRAARQMVAGRQWGIPDLTLYLDVPESVTDRRAARDPGGHPVQLRDRHRRVGRFERLLYERQFPRHLPGRFVSVSGEGPTSEIARVLQERLERCGPVPPATGAEAERLLDLFEVAGPPMGRARPSGTATA